MSSESELSAKNAAELTSDLTTTKHTLLDVQHQLNMAEKVRKRILMASANSEKWP